MSDNYCNMSFAIRAPKDELDIFMAILEIAYKAIDGEFAPVNKYESDLHCSIMEIIEDNSMEYGLGFETIYVGDYLWIHDVGDTANLEGLSDLIQLWMNQEGVTTEVVYFTWAETCSRPVIDAFSGGSCVVTKEDTYWGNSMDYAMLSIEGLKQKGPFEQMEEAGLGPLYQSALLIKLFHRYPYFKTMLAGTIAAEEQTH